MATSTRRRLMAGNWKMNKTNADLSAFFEAFCREAGLSKSSAASSSEIEILFAAPFTLLSKTNELAAPFGIHTAAQNIHFEENGAFTGETSTTMLKDVGIHWTLVGHSERRQYFAESDETVAKKITKCLSSGITPIACLGETRAERESGTTESVVERQLLAILNAASTQVEKIVIAYEPVWAIGTGLAATSAQAQDVHRFIRAIVAKKSGEKIASEIRILYGGSANAANIAELLSQPDIDGALVGGASLKPAEFAQMVIKGRR